MSGNPEINEPNSVSSVSNAMLFISTSDLEKADPATRKLIRSHVMRGRKKKDRGSNSQQLISSPRMKAARSQAVRAELADMLEQYTQLVPARIGSEFSFLQFASDIELLRMVHLTQISPIAAQVIFPLLEATSSKIDKYDWLSLLEADTAALHITIFAIEKFIDKILRHQDHIVNLPAEIHLEKGLRILRERLLSGDEDMRISDSTMGVVLKLASAAHFEGDFKASMHHMEGIRRMVDLRGGLDVFQGKQILAEMLRCDLSIALLNDSDPMFYNQSEEPIISYPQTLLSAYDKKSCLEDNLDFIRPLSEDLVEIWQALRRFCFMVNLGTQTQRLMRPDFIYQTMSAVVYRLLRMRFAMDSIAEALRHGLLAFSYHIFLQWRDIRLPYNFFPDTYRKCIFGLQGAEECSSQLMLWLLMTGAVSVFEDSDEVWLRDCMRDYATRCRAKTWKQMRGILKSFMWIEFLDGHQGKKFCDLLRLDKRRN